MKSRDVMTGAFTVWCRSTFALATVAGGFWPRLLPRFPVAACIHFSHSRHVHYFQ